MKILTFNIVIVTLVYTSTIPQNFKRCFRNDPKFQSCLFDAAQQGVTQLSKSYEEIDLPNLEPLEVASLTLSGRDGSVAVNQNFKGCTLYGLTGIKFQKFELNMTSHILEVSGTIPKLTFSCHYKLDGKILRLPVEGDGNSTIIFTNFQANFFALYDEVKRGEKTHYKTAYNEMTSSAERVHFQFDNLFGGNKILGRIGNQFLNENWEEIYGELQSDYNEVIRQTLTNIINKIWNKVSLEELFD